MVLTNAEEIIKGIKTEGSRGCSDWDLVEVEISRNMGLAKSRIRTLNFGRANFRLFKELLDEISWEAVLREKGAEESCLLSRSISFLFFQEYFFSFLKELSISQNKKVGRGGRKPTGLGKDLQVRLREKKRLYQLWKQGRVTWGGNRDAVQICREEIREVKAWTELNLVGDVKNNKKRFYKYIAQKRQAQESVLPLVNEKGELAMTDMEKAEVLNEFFALVFTGSQDSCISHEAHIPGLLGGKWESKSPPVVRAE